MKETACQTDGRPDQTKTPENKWQSRVGKTMNLAPEPPKLISNTLSRLTAQKHVHNSIPRPQPKRTQHQKKN